MSGYPFSTFQTIGLIWAVLIALFLLIAVVIPELAWRIRKVRADRRWLRQRAAERRRYPIVHVIVLDETHHWSSSEASYARQALSNRQADPTWFTVTNHEEQS